MPESYVDWTVDPESGRCNSSPEYRRLVGEVERLIRDGAHTLICNGPRALAGLIVAQLAHKQKLRPASIPVSPEMILGRCLACREPVRVGDERVERMQGSCVYHAKCYRENME
jgi:hypothetical protein